MRRWSFALGGLIVWAAHFFGCYAVASIFPGSTVANILALLVTLAALAADGILLWVAVRDLKGAGDPFDRWMDWLAAATASLSLVAVLWQGLPAIMV